MGTAKKPEITSTEQFRDAEGNLLKLKKTQFGTTAKAGKMLFCNYMVESYKARKEALRSGRGVREKLEVRINREKKRLADLEKKLAELDQGGEQQGEGEK